jgi:RimJ/RimL family protein N-acetyltransferase
MKPRIYLEKLNAQDFGSYYTLAANERVMAMITGKAQTREEALKKFNSLLENSKLFDSFGSFKVSLRISSELLGFAKLEIKGGKRHEAELGYMLKPEFWGLGYGSEIAGYLMKVAEADPELTRVYAIVDPDHIASKKILLRLGFESEKKCDMDGWPSEVFGRDLK